MGNIPLLGKATKSSPTWSHIPREFTGAFFCWYHSGFQLPFPHRPRSDFQSSQGQRLAGAEPLPTPLLLNPSSIFSLETRNVICSTIQRNRDGLLNRFTHLPPEASGFSTALLQRCQAREEIISVILRERAKEVCSIYFFLTMHHPEGKVLWSGCRWIHREIEVSESHLHWERPARLHSANRPRKVTTVRLPEKSRQK